MSPDPGLRDVAARALARLLESSMRPFDAEAAMEALGDDREQVVLDGLVRAATRLGMVARRVDATPTDVASRRSSGVRYVGFGRSRDATIVFDAEPTRRRVERIDAGGGVRAVGPSPADVAASLGVEVYELVPWVEFVEPDLEGRVATPPKVLDTVAMLRLWFASDARDLGGVVLYAMVAGLLSLVTPLTAQALVTSVAFGTLLQPIVVLGAVLVVFLGATAALRVLKAFVVEILERRAFVRAASCLADRLTRLDRDALGAGAAQRATTRLLEVVAVQKSLGALLLEGLDAVLMAGTGLAVLAFYHPLLLAFDVAIVLALCGVVFGLGRGGVATSSSESDAKYEVVDRLHAIAGAGGGLDLPGGARFAEARTDEALRAWLARREAHFAIVQRQRIGALALQVLAGAGILVVGGGLVIASKLTMGQLVAAELIIGSITASAAKFAKHAASYYDLMTALKKLTALAALPIRDVDGEARGVGEGAASLGFVRRDVEGRPALALSLSARDHSLLVGDSEPLFEALRAATRGAARSDRSTTLASRAGSELLVDGCALGQIAQDVAASRVAWVDRATVFPGTILDNLRFGRPELSQHAIRDALAQVGADAELARLGLSLRSRIDAPDELDEGVSLRLTLARALLGRPGLLVVDRVIDSLGPDGARDLVARLAADDAPHTLVLRSRWLDPVPGVRSRSLGETGEEPLDP